MERTDTFKEVRLGLVCYGGVSLAIYMHGVTKELHKLAVASHTYEGARESNPFPPGQTENVYWELLKRLQGTGVRWRVVIDVISGTSAGGINGIYLAKALAHDLSQDTLRDLWLKKGDIKKLLRGPWFLPAMVRAPFVLGAVLRKRGQGKPPLRGDQMCRWIFRALRSMEPRNAGSSSLVAEGNSLELFATLTDFHGYSRYIPLRGGSVADARHRHVLAFTCDASSQRDQFMGPYDRMLAFAARGTSSFPGAFPPISLNDFDVHVPNEGDPDISNEFFRIYQLSGADARKTFFIDGGVLDNFPFGPTIDAIHRKPASSQVVRRLLYIEPDPRGAEPDKPLSADPPGWLGTIWGGLSGIPTDEPILDDLLRVRERNEKVARIRDVIQAREVEVRAAVTTFLDSDLPLNPDNNVLEEWNEKAHACAAHLTGKGYEAYLQIKTAAVVRAFAEMLNCVVDFPKESNEAALVRDMAGQWARARRILSQDGASADKRKRFLQCFDLPYTARRLRFVVDGVNELYREEAMTPAARASLDHAKSCLYDLQAQFISVLAGRGLRADVVARTQEVLRERDISMLAQTPGEAAPQPLKEGFGELASAYEDFLNDKFSGFGTRLYANFRELTSDWEAPIRRKLVVRYLGFPIWDALVYPLLEIGDIGEIEPIEVVRFSPIEAKKLSDEGPRKLVGTGLHHFKAFFHRRGRETDYTWGRLDGAEQIIALLAKEAGIEDVAENLYEAAFSSIFREEKGLRGALMLQKKLGRQPE